MAELICTCGKALKSKSGLTNHQKKCEIFLEGGEVEPTKDSDPSETPNTSKVTVGSVIILSGAVFWQSASYEWETVNTLNNEVVVREREELNGEFNLICQAVGGQAIWAVNEKKVLSGEMKLKHLVPEDAQPELEPKVDKNVMPTNGKKDMGDASKEVQVYIDSASKYVSARDNKLDAEKIFKKTSTEHKSIIEGFVTKFGVETKPDLGDAKLQDHGFIGHMVKTPAKPGVKRDEDKIVTWLKKHKHKECVKESLDVVKWDALKEAGKVPAEFITEVEEPTPGKDKFQLQIKEDPDAEK